MTVQEINKIVDENRDTSRSPDTYIGEGARRRPIWFEYVGVKKDGSLVYGLDTSPEKVQERTDKFAAGFGFKRKD